MSFISPVKIMAETIEMLPPLASEAGVTRQSRMPGNETLISKEFFLRRAAYRNTVINTSEAFFDDSDMISPYYLVMVYDKISGTPLLSARYYFDKTNIARCLAGDNSTGINQHNQAGSLHLSDYKNNGVFLADRLSGNVSSFIYRQYRQHIFSQLYAEIVRRNKNSSLILMVRKVKHDKQLAKYIRMGFILTGSTLHKGKEHWIIIYDLKKA